MATTPLHDTNVWLERLGGFVHLPAVRALDVRCGDGAVTSWLLTNIMTAQDATIVCIDDFDSPEKEAAFDSAMLNTAQQKVVKLKGDVHDVMAKLAPRSFQLIVIDASTKLSDIFGDMVLAWELLDLNGILVIAETRMQSEGSSLRRRQEAVEHFIRGFDGEFVMVHIAETIMLRKSRNIHEMVSTLSDRNT